MSHFLTNERFRPIDFSGTVMQEQDTVLSDIQQDYNSIIMSSSLRRMQDKTQVFPLNKDDYVRTRLTHSMEVSTIADQIAKYAIEYVSRYTSKLDTIPENRAWLNDPAEKERFVGIAKASGLIHDMGNPPFGHFGEDCIRDWFNDHSSMVLFVNENNEEVTLKSFLNNSSVGYPLYDDLLLFDGNVQALRIVTKLHPNPEFVGMNLTKSLIHTIIKYPYDSLIAKALEKPKFGYNYAEKEIFESIVEATNTKNPRNPMTYILEAADDIAYRTADLEDALQQKVVNIYQVREILMQEMDPDNKNDKVILEGFYTAFRNIKKESKSTLMEVQTWLNFVRTYLIKSVAHCFASDYDVIVEGEGITQSGEIFEPYGYELTEQSFCRNFFRFAKRVAVEKVYDNPQILQTEIAAYTCVYELLDIYVNAMLFHDANIETHEHGIKSQITTSYFNQKVVSTIDDAYYAVYKHDKHANDEAYNLYLRILCVIDHISSMTDNYALNTKRKFSGM